MCVMKLAALHGGSAWQESSSGDMRCPDLHAAQHFATQVDGALLGAHLQHRRHARQLRLQMRRRQPVDALHHLRHAHAILTCNDPRFAGMEGARATSISPQTRDGHVRPSEMRV